MNELLPLVSPVKARVDAFHLRHGGVSFSDGTHYFYPDGAYRDINPFGVLAEPQSGNAPAAIHANMERIVMFYELKKRDAVKRFDELDFHLLTSLPGNPARKLAELERLRSAVAECQKELDAAKAKLDATEVARQRKAIKEAQDEEKARFQEFQKQRRAIRI